MLGSISSPIAALMIGILSGWLITRFQLRLNQQSSKSKQISTIASDASSSALNTASQGSCKLILLIRTDLNMTKGKIVAQCCHATLEAVREAKNSPFLKTWEHRDGQAKITLKVESEDELISLLKKAKEAGLPAVAIRDAGRTQVASGTKTVGAIGPGPSKLIDCVTGHLKLY